MSSSSRTWPWAVSATSTSTPASIEGGRALPGVAEVADGRADHAAGRGRRCEARGNCSDFTKSLTVISPPRRPCVVDQRQPLALVLAQQRGGVLAGDADRAPVTSGIGVITSSTLVVAHSATGVNRRSRLVMMPSSRSSASTTGRPGDAVLAADAVEVLERRVGADRHRVGDDPGLGPLDQVDLVGLVVDRQVAVQDAEAALAGHRDRHPRLGDGVHRGADQRHAQGDLAGQARRGVDLVGRQVGVARQQQHVVVGETEGGELLRNLHISQCTAVHRPG